MGWLRKKEVPEPVDALRVSEAWKEGIGDGLVLVKRPSPVHRFKKLISLSPEIKGRLDAAVVGSHVTAIEGLIDYALFRLAEDGKVLVMPGGGKQKNRE